MLETITKRRKLKPRKSPYWQKVSVGKYIGFYRSVDGGSWHARILLDGKRYFSPLNGAIDSNFEDMLILAGKWYNKAAKSNNPDNVKQTIENTVDDYIQYLKNNRPNDAAYRTRKQLEKHLLPTLGAIELNKLTDTRLKNWRDSLIDIDGNPEEVRRSKDSANRVLSMAKAAFNMAFQSDGSAVESDAAWRKTKPFKKVGASRRLFLKDKQVTSLINHSTGGLQQLVMAGVYTGARAGELTSVLVEDFNHKNATLEVNGKTDQRIIVLSDDAVSFFKEAVAGKLPDAHIFTRDTGEQWISNNYNREFRRAVAYADLPENTVFYSLRHYHISKALKAKIPMQLIAENCGTSVRMIEEHYGKFTKKYRKAMMNKVELGI